MCYRQVCPWPLASEYLHVGCLVSGGVCSTVVQVMLKLFLRLQSMLKAKAEVEEEEEEVTSVQPRGHDEMSTKHTETETTTDHKRWPNEGEK
jgi:hypothetical protein